jgi:hypothetical protein
MFTKTVFAFRNRVRVTALTTLGWSALTLGWLALTWGHYSILQSLASLGIAATLFLAVVGAVWVLDMGLTLLKTHLATMGGLSFVLYWIGFAWGRHTLLQNAAVLMAASLVWLGTVVVLWLTGPAGECA